MKSCEKKCGSCTSCNSHGDNVPFRPVTSITSLARQAFEKRREKTTELIRFRRRIYLTSFGLGTLGVFLLLVFVAGLGIGASLLYGLAAGCLLMIPPGIVFLLHPSVLSFSPDSEENLKNIDRQISELNALIDARFGPKSLLADIEEAAKKWTDESVHCIDVTVANRVHDRVVLDIPSREAIRRMYKQLVYGADHCPCFFSRQDRRPEWERWLLPELPQQPRQPDLRHPEGQKVAA